MPGGVRVHLYCLCWNDAHLLPSFFRHYDDFVDEYFVVDTGSTDDSLKLLAGRERVHVERIALDGDSYFEEERRLYDQIWQNSRGLADWVVVTGIDEHLFRPYMVGYLAHCRAEGVTAIKSHGFEMVADGFPTEECDLAEVITKGCRSVDYDRLCMFNPDAITATHFSPGRIRAWPEGHVVWPSSSEVLALHFEQLGVKYVSARNAERAGRMKPRDIENAWGGQYLRSAQEIVEIWVRTKADARTVPGLGELKSVSPEDYRGDEKIVEQSGLLDADWYLSNNPDLAETGVDPLAHFCRYGWQEGRRPNFYFDAEWYARKYPHAAEDGANPLIHYVRLGERSGEWPSPHFDPEWYAARHGLGPDESPLRHFLLRRASGEVSPLPDFDLEGYRANFPDVIAVGHDPYEDYVRRSEAAATDAEGPHFPGFDEVAAVVGIDPAADVVPASVPWQTLQEVVRLFLRGFPFDEAWYRASYPDVDEAISAGVMSSAREHFIAHGYFEGRGFRAPDGPAADDAQPLGQHEFPADATTEGGG